MDSSTTSPLEYFSRWLTHPIDAKGPTAVDILEALNRLPWQGDERLPCYIMPSRRYHEKVGRFRVFGEVQDLWYCFVYAKEAVIANPPVYFETCLDLGGDYEFGSDEIINGDHVRLSDHLGSFLWYMLGVCICLRDEPNAILHGDVSGILFADPIDDKLLAQSFENPLKRDFPTGLQCLISNDTIVIPDWGAAFLNRPVRDRFLECYDPDVAAEWS